MRENKNNKNKENKEIKKVKKTNNKTVDKTDDKTNTRGYTLVIVESPGKIVKIQQILGNKYRITASIGHIIDLDPRKISVDIDNDFKPIYIVLDRQQKTVNELKKLYKNASEVLIATDEDREGEMIAWSIAHILNIENPKRIVFNSITKDEIINAAQNPTKINQNLVDAQKTRRILDRIIGYMISPILWKEAQTGLSAGRVQSVVVKLIVEKENEIKEFFQNDVNTYFKINGCFYTKKNIELKSQLYTLKKSKHDKHDKENNNKENNDDDISSNKKIKGTIAKILLDDNINSIMKTLSKSIFTINTIIKRESIQNPSPPFTTSTLQQEASHKLGFTTKRTMMAAQRLYEAGYITYMRTDSINLSDEALKKIGDYVIKKYGNDYYRKINYKSKSKNTQEAHEAVRPSNPDVIHIQQKNNIGQDEIRLYNLIWRRTIASQMKPAKYEITDIIINISKLKDYYFLSEIKTLIFNGFLAVYKFDHTDVDNVNEQEQHGGDGTNDTNENKHNLKQGDELKVKFIQARQEYQKPPVRYNEASLVNKLDPNNLNIGRPSTYATIIDKMQKVNYVVKQDNEGYEKEINIITWNGNDKNKITEETETILLGKDTNRFVPTSLGILVTTFLVKEFEEIMDYKFTAQMEEQLDDIAMGKLKWNKFLSKFYFDKFKPIIDRVKSNKTNTLINVRKLGNDPKTNEQIVATTAKYGPVVKKILESGKELYAPIKPPLTVDTITLDDALELFEYPIMLGKYKRKNVTVNRGKYGFYLKIGNGSNAMNITLNTDNYKDKYDTEEKVKLITLDDANKIIEEKEEENKKKILWEKSDNDNTFTILKGPYGYYVNVKPKKKTNVKYKKKNYKISDDVDFKKLTLEKVIEIINNSFKNPRRKFFKKKQ